MRARDIMTTALVTTRPEAEVAEAVQLLLDKRISGLPVVDGDGRLVGLITEGDLLRRSELGTDRRRARWLSFLVGPGRLSEEYAHANGRRVREVMTRDVIGAGPDASLPALVELMSQHGIKRVPIVENGLAVGMVSRADLLRALSKTLRPTWPEPIRDDADILSDIRAEFDRAGFLPAATIDVTVRNGVAELFGTITDERERGAIRVAVENTLGVRHVKDHLVWVAPLLEMVSLSPDDTAPTRA